MNFRDILKVDSRVHSDTNLPAWLERFLQKHATEAEQLQADEALIHSVAGRHRTLAAEVSDWESAVDTVAGIVAAAKNTDPCGAILNNLVRGGVRPNATVGALAADLFLLDLAPSLLARAQKELQSARDNLVGFEKANRATLDEIARRDQAAADELAAERAAESRRQKEAAEHSEGD